MTAAAVLVYPLHRLTALIPEGPSSSSLASRPPPPLHRTCLISALVVLSTAVVPPWALAVWGAGHRNWGLASGMSVGLLAACLSLKSSSFAQQCWCCWSNRREVRQGQEERGPGRVRRGLPVLPLSCGEFLFFLLAAPTLVGAMNVCVRA